MDSPGLISYLRSTTATDSINYTTADCVVDLNSSYHEIEDRIVKIVWEKYFWNRLDTTGVNTQSEYTFSSSTSGNLQWINKTYWVSIDYGGTGDFVKAIKQDSDLLDKDSSYYEINQSKQNPFYEIKDNSLFIYPAPTDGVSIIRHSVANGLIDLTSTTTEANIFNGKIQSKYHYIIALGAREYGFLRRNLQNEAQLAEAKFQRVLRTMLSSLNTRDTSAKKRQTADGFRVNPL